MFPPEYRHLRQLMAAISFFLVILLAGTLGYHFLVSCSFIDAFYMTVITVSTVGFREVANFDYNIPAKIFTIFMILFGMGNLLFIISSFTAVLTDGELRRLLWRRKMLKTIQKLKGHYIVCGGQDEMGEYLIEELEKTSHSFVVVNTSEDNPWKDEDDKKSRLFISGDPSHDDVLLKAGITAAAGILSILPQDKDNLFVTLTARGLNADIRIISKYIDANTREKLKKAGADAMVSPDFIGALRIASEAVRPTAVTFLDKMIRLRSKSPIRFEDIRITADSPLIGKKIRDTDLSREYKLLVVGVQVPGSDEFIYSPPPTHVFEKDSVLVVLGELDRVHAAKEKFGT